MVILVLQLSAAIRAYFDVPVVLTKQYRVCQYLQALPCGVDKATNEISIWNVALHASWNAVILALIHFE